MLVVFGMILMAIVSLVMSYHFLIVRRYEYSSDKISAPVRAVLISDLHDHSFGKNNQRLVKAIRDEKPDLILMVGDFLNDSSETAEAALTLVERLTSVAPVYFSLGNQERSFMTQHGDILLDELRKAGAVVLDKTYLDIEICGVPLRIGGMSDYAFALDGRDSTSQDTMPKDTYAFLTDFQNTERFTLMLSHMPECFVLGEASQTWHIDLVVSGHDHGGQVVLPLFGGLWAGDQGYFPEYVTGLHKKDFIHILITNGLSSKGEALPRFNNPPEICVVELLPVESDVS